MATLWTLLFAVFRASQRRGGLTTGGQIFFWSTYVSVLGLKHYNIHYKRKKKSSKTPLLIIPACFAHGKMGPAPHSTHTASPSRITVTQARVHTNTTHTVNLKITPSPSHNLSAAEGGAARNSCKCKYICCCVILVLLCLLLSPVLAFLYHLFPFSFVRRSLSSSSVCLFVRLFCC